MVSRPDADLDRSRPVSIRARELDLSRAHGWETDGPLGVLEIAPRATVDLRGALAEVAVQPDVPQRATWMRRPASYEAPAAYLTRLSSGMVESRMGVVVHPDAGFMPESIRRPLKMGKHGYLLDGTGELVFPERKVVTVDAPALHLALPFNRNYFHWMYEGLGRLLIARDFLPPEARIAVRLRPPSFRSETLAALGIAPDRVVELPARRLVRFSELYVPPYTVTRDWRLLPIVVHALRSFAASSLGGHGRLYVTRKASSRHISNHAEVLETLGRLGFSELAAETLTVAEQIALFSRAEAVVGVHGAGLANAVFSAPGTLLVELQSPELYSAPAVSGSFGLGDRSHDVFWNLAAVANLQYVRVVCKPVTPGHRNSDIEVDCAHLEEVLRRWLRMR